jgi:hypothetical protein
MASGLTVAFSGPAAFCAGVGKGFVVETREGAPYRTSE